MDLVHSGYQFSVPRSNNGMRLAIQLKFVHIVLSSLLNHTEKIIRLRMNRELDLYALNVSYTFI